VGTILHACVLVWGCAGDCRVLAVPAAGAGDMDNYSVSLSAGPSMQVLTTAPSVYSLTARPGRLHGFIMAGRVHTPKLALTRPSTHRAGRGPHDTARATYLFSHSGQCVSSVFAPTEVFWGVGGRFHSSFCDSRIP
jgi:hypothetical protein